MVCVGCVLVSRGALVSLVARGETASDFCCFFNLGRVEEPGSMVQDKGPVLLEFRSQNETLPQKSPIWMAQKSYIGLHNLTVTSPTHMLLLSWPGR